MNKENELSTISTSSGADTSKNNLKNVERPAKVNKKPELNDILKKLSEISDDINTLNHIILNQSEKIDNLLSLLEEKESAGKKNVFGLARK